MELIDKDTLIAEIEKKKIPFKRDIEDGNYPTYLCALMDFEDFINSLETKEVDLDKEMAELLAGAYQRQYHHNTYPELSNNSEFVTSKEEIKEACMQMAKWKEQQESEKKCILCKYYQPYLLKCDNLGLESYSEEFFEEFHCCDFIEDNDRKYKPKKQNKNEHTGNNKRTKSN